MTNGALMSFAIAMAALSIAAPSDAASDRPNIVIFLSDDHRADVLGCAGHGVVETPHIDRLAAGGVRFAEAFVTTSICAASRATILTGLVERTHGYTFGRPPLAKAFCAASYPHRLREHGYRTGFVGKLGLSVQGGAATIERMFDSFVPLARNPYVKTLADGSRRHVTDITGDKAIEFIRTTPRGTPFCLSVSFNAAHAEDGDTENHYPFPESEAMLYRDVAMPRPKLDGGPAYEKQPAFLKDSLNRRRYFWRWDTPEKYERNLRNYFRMLGGLDRNIGRVVDEIAARGLAGNTIIIFTSDNGYYMGERGFAGKWSHYEQSLRVPLVVLDPRQPRAMRGRVVETTALNLDIAPTILAAAGIEPDQRMQGRPLGAVLQSGVELDRAGFFCEHRMKHPHLPRWEGYRTGRYKYARYLDVTDGNEFLHDLESDPDELTNLATDEARADVLARMRAECSRLSALYAAAAPPLPRVLMLGDSISLGYHEFVVAALTDEATVVRPRENCAGTTKALRKIDEWLRIDGGGFDVIHFNFGLHDLKHVTSSGGNSNDPSDRHQADLETYERNLREIVVTLEATGATLVFATTSPVPSGGVRPHRDPEDVVRYNDVATRIMLEHDIAIDDLHGFAAPRLAEIQRRADVHFTRDGSRRLGDEVARHVRHAVRRRLAE